MYAYSHADKYTGRPTKWDLPHPLSRSLVLTIQMAHASMIGFRGSYSTQDAI